MAGAGEGGEVLRRGCVEASTSLAVFHGRSGERTASEEQVEIFLDERESRSPNRARVQMGRLCTAYVAESKFIPIQTRSTSASSVPTNVSHRPCIQPTAIAPHCDRACTLGLATIALQCRRPRVRHPEAHMPICSPPPHHTLFWPSQSPPVYNPRAGARPIDSDGPALPLPRFRFLHISPPPLSPPTDPPRLPPRSAPLLLQPPSSPLLRLFHVPPSPSRPKGLHPCRVPIDRILPRRRHILCTRCKSQLSAAPRARHRPFRQQNHHCPSLCPSVRQERRLKASKNMESRSRETTLLPPGIVRIIILSALPTAIKRPFSDLPWVLPTGARYTCPPSRPTSTAFIINYWASASIQSLSNASNPTVASTQRLQRYPVRPSPLFHDQSYPRAWSLVCNTTQPI